MNSVDSASKSSVSVEDIVTVAVISDTH